MLAPKIAGTASKNENFPAFFGDNPSSTPDEIVAPLLEIPGKIAIASLSPVRKAPGYPNLPDFPVILIEAIKRKIPVIANPSATKSRLSNALSKYFLKKMPAIPEGIEPMIMNTPSLKLSLLYCHLRKDSIISVMSFPKYTKTAIREPKCTATSKSSPPEKFRNLSKSTRCPELDIGNHSVIPCTTARIMLEINSFMKESTKTD